MEDLNSVMDDNKLLTLPNGERIRLQPHCRLLFEVADLQYASPATISRCGMVFVDPQNLGHRPFFSRYVRTRAGAKGYAAEAASLATLYERFAAAAIAYVFEGDTGVRGASGEPLLEAPLALMQPAAPLALVRQLCALLDTSLRADGPNDDAEELAGHFLFATLWSVGAVVAAADRPRLSAFLLRQATTVAHAMPDEGCCLYDAYFCARTRRWVAWASAVPPYAPPAPFEFHRILVPTPDSVRDGALLARLTAAGTSVLLVGESGTAKSVALEAHLASLDPGRYCQLAIALSSRTSSRTVQAAVEAAVDKRAGRTYGPPPGKRLVVFVDDLHMPAPDRYGTQQPSALLLALVCRGVMYDRGKDLEQRSFKDLQFLGALQPPGGGRHSVDPRLVAQFAVFGLAPPSLAALHSIYDAILTRALAPFAEPVRAVAARLTAATIRVYRSVLDALPPTPSKFHYTFTQRDLGRVCAGLLLVAPDGCVTAPALWRLWAHELRRVFCDRLLTPGDASIVERALADAAAAAASGSEDAGGEGAAAAAAIMAAVAEPCHFGDWMGSADRLERAAAEAAAAVAGRSAATAAVRELQDAPETTEPPLQEPYRQLEGGYHAARGVLQRVLACYNATAGAQPMQLVLFDALIDHAARLLRVLRLPHGHALLVGVGGSGKQSVVRLATFTAGYRLFEIALRRGYGEGDFREDVRSLYRALLSAGPPVVWLLTDAHLLVCEGCLELVNSLLTTGTVPALFTPDERAALCAAEGGRDGSGGGGGRDADWAACVARARANLHIVLAMSPSGDALRRRCRAFPGLVAATTIDFFAAWPREALRTVAASVLDGEPLLPEALRAAVTDHVVAVHCAVLDATLRFEAALRRRVHVTPKHFLEYLACYAAQLARLTAVLRSRADRLEGGLAKLAAAQDDVDRLASELRAQQVVVAAKTGDVQALLADISSRQAGADVARAEAAATQAALETSAAVIAVESARANTALEAALPALAAAERALESLNKDDITELKAFASPPPLVMNVCLAVMALRPTGREVEADGWKGAKAMISDTTFLKCLRGYDKDGITDRMARRVDSFFADRDFNLDKMATVSRAGAGLLQWVIAIKAYYAVAKGVEPLRARVKEMERSQDASGRALEATTAQLATLTVEIAALGARFKAASAEQAELQARAGVMERRLAAASQLVSGLSSERARWAVDAAALRSRSSRLVGDALLAAACLVYLGPFTADYRRSLLNEVWVPDLLARAVPCTTPFSLEALLVSEATVQRWVAEGLPADAHSVMNGLITTHARRFPLCVDPQQQAVAWLKAHEGAQLRVGAMGPGADFMQPLKLALQYGRPFLFEGVDETLDPLVGPVLEQATFVEGADGGGSGGSSGSGGGPVAARTGAAAAAPQQQARLIMLDDTPVPWDDGFRLFLTTKLANPRLSPETMGTLAVVNYSVTPDGLENQLLDAVVAHERPDLERQFKELVSEVAVNGALLEELEETLLRTLVASSGNILDNAQLVATLEESKQRAGDIERKLAASVATKGEIARAREQYRPVAKRGSILFFVVSGLSALCRMYETSLASFLGVFRRALGAAKRASAVELRLRYLLAATTRDVFDATCTGLFERHKLLFAVQLAMGVLLGEGGALSHAEVAFLLRGDTALAAPTHAAPQPQSAVNPAASWLPDASWRLVMRLATLAPVLGGLPSAVASLAYAWRAWAEGEAPERAPLPGTFADAPLSSFQRLLVLRCFRPDRVYAAAKQFVASELGDAYVQPPVLDYARVHSQSSPATPIVCILSPGADPLSDIQALGASLGISVPSRLRSLALGQGQARKAEELLEVGMARGHWVLLQNAHLLTGWLPTLEKLLVSAATSSGPSSQGSSAAASSSVSVSSRGGSMHPDFRLFLTTDPCDGFPLGILQRAIKVVTEPPDGLKLNMRASLTRLAPHMLAECNHPAYKPLVYTLMWLHSVLLERRKYGKLGFNVSYDFNESDFAVSRRLLALYLQKAKAAAASGLAPPAAAAAPEGSFDAAAAAPGASQSGGGAPWAVAAAGGAEVSGGSLVASAATVPWASLKFLIGDAMYGGRVSDSFDRRVLATYLDEFMGPFLFEGQPAPSPSSQLLPQQHAPAGVSVSPVHAAAGGSAAGGVPSAPLRRFHFSRAGFDYTLPERLPTASLEQMTACVETLPLLSGPAVIGLHPNAEIGYFHAASDALCASLLQLQPRDAIPSAPTPAAVAVVGTPPAGLLLSSREDVVLVTVRQLCGRVPPPYDCAALRKRLLATNAVDATQLQRLPPVVTAVAGPTPLPPLSPSQVVLLQELEAWNRLVTRMAASLDDVARAMAGEIALTDALEDVADSLFNGVLPASWRVLAPATDMRLRAWMAHFDARHMQYARWARTGCEPRVMWLSGLHVPESYLTALVQATCRRHGWALDRCAMSTSVTRFTSEQQLGPADALEDGCYVRGLFLEGATWDAQRGCLARQPPKQLACELPLLKLVPIASERTQGGRSFRTPVYVTPSRRDAMGAGLAFEADLITDEHASLWALQGVACVLNTSCE